MRSRAGTDARVVGSSRAQEIVISDLPVGGAVGSVSNPLLGKSVDRDGGTDLGDRA